MEFKVDRDVLVNSLNLVIGGVNPRNTLPILGNVLVETIGQDTLQLIATDLEVGLSTKITAKIAKEGSVTVPARKFFDIIREMPAGEIEITVAKNNAVNIKTGKTFCRVMGLGREDFPKLPEFDLSQYVALDQKIMKDCLSLTVFAISHDETRYVLNGVLISGEGKKARFIATDGRRLAFIEKELEKEIPKPFQVIIPAKAVHELGKILKGEGEVKLIHLQNQIIFHLGDTFLVSRLIEGHFPNYEQVIPKEEHTIGTVDRAGFLSAIKRASLFTSQDAQAVKLDFVNGKVLVSSHSPNLGEVKEELEAAIKGDDVSIGFNPQYLIDALKILDTDQISVSLTKPDKPGLIRSRNDYLYVVMPMQIA